MDTFCDSPIDIDKEFLSDVHDIANGLGELVIVVEIDAEGLSEVAFIGERGISWVAWFDVENFAGNGNFGIVRASESSGDLGLVIGGEEVDSVDFDVLAGISAADGNDEVNIASFTE